MNAEAREQILKALWPEGEKSKLGVWAILDCARDPTIYLALLESRLEFRCLYSGKLPRALEMVAPHLVELFPDSRLTAKLLDDGWGRAWGVFLKIEDPSNLRHHLRKFLKVRDEAGRFLIFRFYDPRVLRAYLPSCVRSEWQQFLGPVSDFMVEGHGGESLIKFSRDGLRLRQDHIGLRPMALQKA